MILYPKGSSWAPQENLRMSGPLLSRFDLIYVLLDSSDETRDRQLSEHVLALHSGTLPSSYGVVEPSTLSIFEYATGGC